MTLVNGLDFHVEVAGCGQPLVLLHGFTGSSRAWDGVRPTLADSCTVVSLDLIGHGQSPSPADPGRYTFEWSARDLAALLDTLGYDSVDLLGYSMGGRLALHFAVHSPDRVRRLILESASAGIEDDAERQLRMDSDDALARRILEGGVAAFVDEWERQPLLALAAHVPDHVRAQQHQQRLNNSALGLANSLRGMGAGRQTQLWPALSALDVPVLLVVGALDVRYRGIAERMGALLPRAELVAMPDAGHTVHLDQPAEFVRVVNKLTHADRRCYIDFERLF